MVIIKINRDRCKSCGLCVKFCPRGLVVLDKKLGKRGVHPAVFDGDPGKCTGCGNCAVMCPEAAIEIEDVPDGAPCPAGHATTNDSED